MTGAAGYLGSRVSSALREGGWSVLELTRTPDKAGAPGLRQVRFSFEDGVEGSSLSGASALIHCAYDFRPRTWSEIERVNVAGSRRLFATAADAGVQTVICISTLSAFEGCRSTYGKAKLAIEAAARDFDAMVVRPGLVFGPHAGGMFGSLRRLALASPVLPLITGERQRLHLVHEDDVARALTLLLRSPRPFQEKPLIAAASRSASLRDVLNVVAEAHGRRLRFIRVPWHAAWGGLRALEAVGVRPPFRSDSVISLANLDQNPFDEGRAIDGFSFRPFSVETLRAASEIVDA